ncbi:hypothetical protein [uncultured Aeromicrobium sp.]|uniref:alcohol dehydrogenase catalytic domain-containing protein n=1 Tax=uncultured Aeromicrobium sp. TaxID=337820 RepID=UPI002598DC45|nr:hypothetical protein [uncultured Aeromicrobium sp.]
MRAVGFHAPGGPEVVEVLDVPEPDRDDLLVVDVAGAAVNPVDLATRSGQIPTEGTTLLGWDLAGTVLRAPHGSGFAAGDRVAAMTAPLGTGIASMAERVALDPAFAVAVPASLDLLVAAAPELVDRSGVRRWAGAPMGGFRVGETRGESLALVDAESGEEHEVLDLGLTEQVPPGSHVLGRLVPVEAGPGTALD